MINPELLKMIKRHEGFSGKPYVCSQGYTTIGYGRNLDSNPLTESEASVLLQNDIYKAIRQLDKYKWFQTVDEVRCEALIDFMFNVGPGTFAQFKKMIAAIEKEDWEEASNQLLDSRYAKQVGYRAHVISYMLYFNAYPSKEEIDIFMQVSKNKG